MNKKVTIKDVAKKSNVSVSTVSRVMAGSDTISERTTKKVLSVIKEMGYIPNATARSLANNKTNAIGIVMPSAKSHDLIYQNQFYIEMLTELSLFAENTKYYLITLMTSEKSEYTIIENIVNSKRVDGLILLISRIEDENIKFLHKNKIPFVVIGNIKEEYKDRVFSVNNDNEKISYSITKNLINNGYKKILFIGGDRNLFVTNDRLSGFRKAFEDENLNLDPSYISYMKFSEQEAYNKVKGFDKKIDAIFTTDDIFAIGAKRAISDIPIIGFNNSRLSKVYNVSTVDIKTRDMAKSAMEILIDELEGKKVENKNLLVPAEYVKRFNKKI